MTDLDIQIDVPDDDDLNSPVRVLNGSWVPPWVKAIAVLLAGALFALAIGAFLLGRSRADESDVLVPPTVATTPLSSAVASPSIDSALGAVQDWENFVSTGDLDEVTGSFDPDGPQYALFMQSVGTMSTGQLDFAARNLSETTDGVVTTVSMDLVISGPDGQEVLPYDFVYLDGRPEVWTVVDRRSPGTAAIPPAAEMIDSAKQNWSLFTSSMAEGDGSGVADAVSADSLVLADQIARAADGGSVPAEERLVTDAALFDLLVDRAARSTADEPGEVVIAVLDENQREALITGDLTAWTQTDPDRIIASLQVTGDPVALVPFAASAEGWTFDLVEAMNTSGGSR